MIMAAERLNDSHNVMDGSWRVSEKPGMYRAGGTERVPPFLAPSLQDARTCLACTTDSIWGIIMEAPASSAVVAVRSAHDLDVEKKIGWITHHIRYYHGHVQKLCRDVSDFHPFFLPSKGQKCSLT